LFSADTGRIPEHCTVVFRAAPQVALMPGQAVDSGYSAKTWACTVATWERVNHASTAEVTASALAMFEVCVSVTEADKSTRQRNTSFKEDET
jgi:hypothetical protein